MILDEALKWAVKLIGTKEVPPKSNRGLVIDDIEKTFGYKGVAYCALFAQWCYKRACSAEGIGFPFPGTASSQTLFKWAKSRGVAGTDFKELKRGDIVIWQKYKIWQGHVGIVTDVDYENGKFMTIEGNTSNSDFGSQSEGDGIYARVRYMKKMDFVVDSFWLKGFIHIDRVFPEYLDLDPKPVEIIS